MQTVKNSTGFQDKTVLILGANGMLGHVLFIELSRQGYSVYATTRLSSDLSSRFPSELRHRILGGVEASSVDALTRVLATVQPDIVINCIGIIKQLPIAKDPLISITINALLPHRLALLCKATGARLLHISTDCVFNGQKGSYTEADASDADDLYGRSKFLGEVNDPHCITLRTSIIGHELNSCYGLIEWFLAQQHQVQGFTQAIYSGFPTIEIARIIGQYVIPQPELSGIYQVSSAPISKYDLLQLVAQRYGKAIIIEPATHIRLDRSLDSRRFQQDSGYCPPPWEELVDRLYQHFLTAPCYHHRHP